MRRDILAVMLVTSTALAACHSHGDEHNAEDGHNHGAEAVTAHEEGDETAHAGEIHFTAHQAEAAGLQLETVQAGEFRSVLHVGGEIQALQGDEQTIVATSGGVLRFANGSITEGTAVRGGETIATVSADKLQDGDPVQKARLAFETAEREFQRAERLVADKIISQKDFEQVCLRYETARAAYEGQASSLTAKGVKLVAPISGYIKQRLVAQGEYVAVGQPIAVVAQNRRLQLRADVAEQDYRHLRDVRTANFRTSYDDTVHRLDDLNGRLVSCGRTATDGASYIPVTFEFDNVGDFLPGAFADVWLLSSPRRGVVSIPVSSLTEEQGLKFVYLLIADEIYKKQEIHVGQSDGKRVEILHGLAEGDRVVTHGAYQVKLASASAAIPAHSHSH